MKGYDKVSAVCITIIRAIELQRGVYTAVSMQKPAVTTLLLAVALAGISLGVNPAHGSYRRPLLAQGTVTVQPNQTVFGVVADCYNIPLFDFCTGERIGFAGALQISLHMSAKGSIQQRSTRTRSVLCASEPSSSKPKKQNCTTLVVVSLSFAVLFYITLRILNYHGGDRERRPIYI